MASHAGADDDDEGFLLGVEAAEAAALASKRRRLSSSPAAAEGSYMAALKGNHSSLWKQQQQKALAHKRSEGHKTLAPASGCGAPAAKGACFKCGDTSHWARECPLSAPPGGGGGGGGGGEPGGEVEVGGVVEEKACPCGAGSCVVFTSTTPRNPGRKFYRCPLRDNGGCNFFEWCDTPSSGVANAQKDTVYQSDTSVANMLCPCGSGTCLILTTKTGKNVGRRFYRCPANQGGGYCGFFKWCDEQQLRATAPQQASQQYQIDVTSGSHNSIERSPSSCFRCGQESHWAKDCPNQSSDPYSDNKGRTLTPVGSSDACFKCGKAGHWSQDCPAVNYGSGAAFCRTKSYACGSQKSHGY